MSSKNIGERPIDFTVLLVHRLGSRRVPSVTLGAVKRLGAALAGLRRRSSPHSSPPPSPGPGGVTSTDSELELRAYYVRRAIVGPLASITRTADGRFVLDSASSSDDGGFAPRGGIGHASWRRPLVATPSQAGSLRSEGSGESLTLPRPRVAAIYSPPLRASSPGPLAAWPVHNFSDLSSVLQPSSMATVDLTLPTPSQLASSLRSVHERYSQELPSLHAIHAEVAPGRWQHVRAEVHRPGTVSTTATAAAAAAPHRLSGRHVHTPLFRPLQPLAPSGPLARPWALPVPKPSHILPLSRPAIPAAATPRIRQTPRRSANLRHARSAPELRSSPARPPPLEPSPESRSSSSGFGSKNTSQQTGSSRSPLPGPPYRPPPPPPVWLTSSRRTGPIPLCLTPPWPPPPYESPPPVDSPAAVARDASVDDHYEFDADLGTPVTTPSPGGQRQLSDRGISDSEVYGTFLGTSTSLSPSKQHQDIEARVQAMKQEFHEYRQRQARRRLSHELESAC
jgi:hypothetical protein